MSAFDELGGWPALLTELIERRDLPADHARAAMATILAGEATPAQLIGFVVALRAKGETPEELSGLLDAVLGAASIVELSEAMSPDLQEELRMLALPFKDGEVPSEGEIRVAKAQLVGWLEGLFHGIQATLFAQQLAARQQLEQIRQLPPGSMGQVQDPSMANERPGTYL